MLTTIRDRLADIEPQYRDEFYANQQAYTAELEQLDQDINARLKHLSGHKFMVFHPSWGYFADAYQLEQVAIEKLGKEPGARTLARLINQARSEQIKVIFVQPQFSQQSAAQIARAIGGRVIAIDPLASEYIKNLQHITQQLAEAMQ
jgi:zinc transport system substrate-binding protein